MKNISLFKNFTKEIGSRTLSQIVEEIRGDHYKEPVLKIRELVKSGNPEEVSRLKKGLVAFTVSGLFEGGRKMSFLKIYNPFVILDIDKLDREILPDLILKAKEIPFTKVLFVSPSGRGLKIIVEVNTEIKKHGVAYWQVMNFYKDNLNVEIDKSGKDITRLCFMSYDPEAYFNDGSAVFNILNQTTYPTADTTQSVDQAMGHLPGRAPDLSIEAANLSGNYQEAFGVCVMQTNAKLEFKKGNRNNYIYQLGVICSHAGIPLEVAINESKKAFDFNDSEIERTIKSAYSWQPYQPEEVQVELPVEAPPMIPAEVFNDLPGILKRGCEVFEHERERDVFLTSALGVLSGLLPNVKGLHGGHDCYPNLYVFVVAPAASGKGALRFAKLLGFEYQKEVTALNDRKRTEYKKAFKEYASAKTKFKLGTLEEQPERPEEESLKTLFIPANSSSAMMIEHLANNNDTGILFESEADTLGNVLKHEWGGYSDTLRKAYHHETVSYSRKSAKDLIEINEPKLTVVLSGTPGQITNLIPSAEDGLFSRFVFYAFQVESVWLDMSPKGRGKNSKAFFQELSKEVLEMINFLKKYPTEFSLKDEHWNELNANFEEILEITTEDYGHEAESIVKRLGVICYKIAMVLSTVRKFEQKVKDEELFASDQDFKTALCLTKIYWKHALFVFDRLPKSNKFTFQFKNKRKENFYNLLPDKFMRKEADLICKRCKISTRSGSRYLRELLKQGYLRQTHLERYGEYSKTKKS